MLCTNAFNALLDVAGCVLDWALEKHSELLEDAVRDNHIYYLDL